MAECLLLKSGGQTKKLPVLNASYPANVTNWQGEQATFRVEIATAGVPAEYTYQWYRDGAKWTGATKATVSWSSAAVGSHSIYCVVPNKAGEVTRRVATLTAAGWTGSAAPYVQEAVVEGLLGSDSPIVAVSMENATVENYEAILESWANVNTIDAGDGKITAKCFGEKPAADLTLLIKVVR